MPLFVGSILVLFGLLNILLPGLVWFFSIGWQFRDAEPSDTALKVNRIIGYFLLIVGVCYILSFFFPSITA
ncbi:DUF6199 family natural product biosynthesis protein [Lysinibacillus sp. 54212]|uniref:DUF6199 family natural product biosynthesis protein n=1 Tax=Lysinibacillus sp. 54212 TaxID=3119829 RepID=UPI002FCBECC9